MLSRKKHFSVLFSSFRFQCIVLIGFFLLLRLTTLFSAYDTVYHGEEIYRGTVALEILKGLPISLTNYYPENYSVGGFLLITFMLVPFFYLFGPILIVLKIPALILSVIAYILAIVLMKRFFSEKTALIAGWLLLFSPPVLTALSLVGNGDHADVLFLSLLVTLNFFYFLENPLKKRYVAMMGLLSGISFWFIPTTLSMTLSVLLCWFIVHPKKLFGKLGGLYLLFLMIGLSPWIKDQYVSAGGGFSIFTENITGLIQAPRKIVQLLFFLPINLFSGIFLKQQALLFSGLYSLIMLFVFIFYFVKLLRSKFKLWNLKVGFFFVFIFIHLVLFSVGSHEFGSLSHSFSGLRFFAPLYFLLLLLLSIILSSFSKKLRVIFLLPLISLGVIGQSGLVFQEPWAQAANYRGYSYKEMGEVWAQTGSLKKAPLLTYRELEGIVQKPNQKFFYWGYVEQKDISSLLLEEVMQVPALERSFVLEKWGFDLVENKQWERVGRAAKKLTEPDQAYFYRGVARAAIQSGFVNPEELLKFFKEDKHLRKYFWFEYGVFAYRHSFYFDLQKIDVALTKMKTEEKDWFWRGVGRILPLKCFKNPQDMKCRHFFSFNEAKYLNQLKWGAGWDQCENFFEDSTRAKNLIKRNVLGEIQSAFRGFEACRDWYKLSSPTRSLT